MRDSLPPCDSDALYKMSEGWPRVQRLIAGTHLIWSQLERSFRFGEVDESLSALLFSHPRSLCRSFKAVDISFDDGVRHELASLNSRDDFVLQELSRRAQRMVQRRIFALQGSVDLFVLGRTEEEKNSSMRVGALLARLELINLAEFRPGGASCARALVLRSTIVRAEALANKYEARKKTRISKLAVDALIIFARERAEDAAVVPSLCTALWREEVVWNSLSRSHSNRAGRTSLMYAAMKHDVGAVRWLLQRGARVNAVDLYLNHALSYAMYNIEPLPHNEFFRSGGFNSSDWVNGYSGRSRPPLCRQCALATCACPREGDDNRVLTVVRLLITAMKRDKRMTADAVVNFLSQKVWLGPRSRNYPSTVSLPCAAMIFAERTGNNAVLREVMDEYLTQPLAAIAFTSAAGRGELDVINLLLSRGLVPDGDALVAAARLGFVEAALTLARNGAVADANVRDCVKNEFVNRATSQALMHVRTKAMAEFEMLWPKGG